jgi:hypothetical protein
MRGKLTRLLYYLMPFDRWPMFSVQPMDEEQNADQSQ